MSLDHFALVCGHPETLVVPTPPARLSLSDAVEDVFVSSTNLLVLEWNGVSVPLSFKYDVSWVLLDAIEMVEQMLAARPPTTVAASFPSNSFQVEWEIDLAEDGGVEINAKWNAVGGNVAGLLADRSPLLTTASVFVTEWRHLFAVLVRAIGEARMPVEMIDHYDRLLPLARFKQEDVTTLTGIAYPKESESDG